MSEEAACQGNRYMNKTQISNLLAVVLSVLGIIAMFFFAATDSKRVFVFLAIAVFLALNGSFWAYRSAKGRRAL